MPDVCALPQYGRTPLHAAASNGHLEVVKELLAAGADVKAADKDGESPLHVAASEGHPGVVKVLLAAGADVKADGETPLQLAAFKGHLKVVKELLSAGADVKAADWFGRTPLHAAARCGHLEVVQELLAAGADVKAAKKDGETPLQLAASMGHWEVVKELLAAGAYANSASEEGRTRLRVAAFEGHLEVVKVLLEAGADVKAADWDGWTPLFAAAFKGHLEVVKELLAAGADVKTANWAGETPLHAAASNGHLGMVKELLAAGADTKVADIANKTALFIAIEKDNTEVVMQLLKSGASVQAGKTAGGTPLQLVSTLYRYKDREKKQGEIAKILVRHILDSKDSYREFLEGEESRSLYTLAFHICRTTIPSTKMSLLALVFLLTCAWLQFSLLALVLTSIREASDGNFEYNDLDFQHELEIHLLNEHADSRVLLSVFARLLVMVYIIGVAEADCRFSTRVQTESFQVIWSSDEGGAKFVARFMFVVGLLCPLIQAATAVFAIYVAYEYLNSADSVMEMVMNGVGIVFVLGIDDLFGDKLLHLATAQYDTLTMTVRYSRTLELQQRVLKVICIGINISLMAMAIYCVASILYPTTRISSMAPPDLTDV
ncbi:hypothetical protein GPECTOR_135g625 [Gonium pectorale]|uniref:Uncharacterized protein n=1 Tax=Gonium pectorale TaxID=33097 RepID=A0A150FY68_GONPE|nr:hypothetical protein GPECTOR_135g625 [Gonium pectorale]|eukprot:KXZ42561.1 hypothetical protein GPECTOR_135g625 [Gonium pectorale]